MAREDLTPTSAGTGDDAYTMRENLYESLTAADQAVFLRELEDALEAGMTDDQAWERAWLKVENYVSGAAAEDEDVGFYEDDGEEGPI